MTHSLYDQEDCAKHWVQQQRKYRCQTLKD